MLGDDDGSRHGSLEGKITFRQWEVIAWITLEGELSQVELAESIGIEAPTLAGILARMERDGGLERFACPMDRRRKRIRTTAKAETVWNRMVECCHCVRDRATQEFSSEELETLKQSCNRNRQNLNGFVAKECFSTIQPANLN